MSQENGNQKSSGFVWEDYLEDSNLVAASDSAFTHVYLVDACTLSEGSVVEVAAESGRFCWPARVTLACGSLLRLRYVGSGGPDFWCDFHSGRVHPLGWGWQQNVDLLAPAGALPADVSHEKMLADVLPSGGDAAKRTAAGAERKRPLIASDIEKIEEGMKLEVLDESIPYHVWTATVLERSGLQLRLRLDTLDNTPDLWLSVSSPRVRHFGWAAATGEPFKHRPPTASAATRTQAEWDAILEMSRDEARQMAMDTSILPHTKYEFPVKHSLSEGCQLEAVHPDRSAICAASVVSVLDAYFFRVQIDDSDVSWLSSLQDPNILPYGWCRAHGLDSSGDDLLPSRAPSPASLASSHAENAHSPLEKARSPLEKASSSLKKARSPLEKTVISSDAVLSEELVSDGQDSCARDGLASSALSESRDTIELLDNQDTELPPDSQDMRTPDSEDTPVLSCSQESWAPSERQVTCAPSSKILLIMSDSQGSEPSSDSQFTLKLSDSEEVELTHPDSRDADQRNSHTLLRLDRVTDAPPGGAGAELYSDEAGSTSDSRGLAVGRLPVGRRPRVCAAASIPGQRGSGGTRRPSPALQQPQGAECRSIASSASCPSAVQTELRSCVADKEPFVLDVATEVSVDAEQPVDDLNRFVTDQTSPVIDAKQAGVAVTGVASDAMRRTVDNQRRGSGARQASSDTQQPVLPDVQPDLKPVTAVSNDGFDDFISSLDVATGDIAPALASHRSDHDPAASGHRSVIAAPDGVTPTGDGQSREEGVAATAAVSVDAASEDQRRPEADPSAGVGCGSRQPAAGSDQRLQPASLAPQTAAEQVGLAADTALEVVDPEAPGRLCAAVVRRTAGHLVWLRLLSLSGAPELIYPHSSDSLFPVGWAVSHDVAIAPPDDWLQIRASSEPEADACPSAAQAAGPERELGMESSANTWTTPLFVNTSCNSGPIISLNKLVAQPRLVGPGPVRLVARELLTRLVWAGYQGSRVLKHLQLVGQAQPGWTTDLLKVKVNNTIYGGVVELPSVRSQMESLCAGVCSRLGCCAALVALQRYTADTCPYRCRSAARPAYTLPTLCSRAAEVAAHDGGRALLKERLGPAKRQRPHYLHAQHEPPARRRRGRPPRWLRESAVTSTPAGPLPAATPALYQVSVEKSPRLWDGADLEKYLRNTECAHLVDKLRQQDMDGVSFMLLTCTTLTEVLDLSEQDALALCSHVSRVKYTYFSVFSD